MTVLAKLAPLLTTLLVCVGCHDRLRLASPQIQRMTAPKVTCIVVVEGNVNEEVVEAAIDACRDAATSRTDHLKGMQ